MYIIVKHQTESDQLVSTDDDLAAKEKYFLK